MEYALASDETIDEGIRRLFVHCVEETITLIRPPQQDINTSMHNTRKSLKFMRALLRLLKSPLEPDIYRQENLFFRDLGREISQLRDLHVMGIILEYAGNEAHSVRPQDIEPGRNELKSRQEKLFARAESKQLFERVASGLEESLSRFERLPKIPNQLSALLPGLKFVYKSGYDHYRQARENPDKEHFHEWRKQVKYLLHHFQILQIHWPSSLGINGTSLQKLSDYLGEEHDLAVFRGLLQENLFRKKLRNIKALITFVDQKRSHLQKSALNLGEFIYAREPADFISFFE